MFRKILIWLLIAPSFMSATELMPWLSRDFEFQARSTYLFQYYPKIQTPEGSFSRPSYDSFLDLSLGMAALGWSGELETTIAYTRHQRPSCDNIRLTGRYVLWDDIIGDPFTITLGITATQAFKLALHDISSFHHGQIAGEAHVAIGKETPFMSGWLSRWWTVLGLGLADRGSPWIRVEGAWEKNWWNVHQLRIFAHSLWGIGNDNISPCKPFRGYGSIAHRSIDLGIRYTYNIDFFGSLSAAYSFRIYGHNFPEYTQRLFIILHYPFGVGI